MIISRLWFIGVMLNVILAGALYHTKYRVIDLERSYLKLTNHLTKLQETHHTLQAEYSLLSCPKRLAHLAHTHMPMDGNWGSAARQNNGSPSRADRQHINGVRLVSTLKPMIAMPSPEELIGEDQEFPD